MSVVIDFGAFRRTGARSEFDDQRIEETAEYLRQREEAADSVLYDHLAFWAAIWDRNREFSTSERLAWPKESY